MSVRPGHRHRPPFTLAIHLGVLEVAANEDFSLLRRHLPPSSAPLELFVRSRYRLSPGAAALAIGPTVILPFRLS